MDALTHHDAGGLQLERAASFQIGDVAEAVDGPTEGIDRATEVPVTDRDGENLARSVDDLSFFDTSEIAEDDGANLALVQVHGQT